MHLMRRQDREDLGLAKLPEPIKQYISDLELTVDRLQVRSRAHRIQLRACSAKLENVNLRNELARLAGQAKVQKPICPQNQTFTSSGKRMRRAV